MVRTANRRFKVREKYYKNEEKKDKMNSKQLGKYMEDKFYDKDKIEVRDSEEDLAMLNKKKKKIRVQKSYD